MKVALTTLNAKFIHPNLAIRWLYVAQTPGHEARIFEFTIKEDLDKCTQRICEFQPDVIGVSCYIWNASYLKTWIRKMKEAMPQARIILGGPEVSFEYQRYLFDEVDAILRGEGEVSFWQYVDGKKEIEGIVTRDYISPVTYAKVDVRMLEKLPSPYLLEFDRPMMSRKYLYVETSRGCPYQCSYCLASLDNKIRDFSLEYLFDLLDRLRETDVQQVKFLDRTFNYSNSRSMAIAQKLLTMPETMSFQFEVMADRLSDEMMDLIINNPVKSRFRFEVGLQSFNCDALEAVGRRQNLDKLCENIRIMRKHETIVHVDLIAGLPYEDLNSFKETYQKLFSLDASEMQVGILKLLHGSKLYYQQDEFQINASQESPYQIIDNPWVRKEDIEAVEMVALASEKLWNRSYCKDALWYLYEKGYQMFDYMRSLGEKIDKLGKPYQPHQLFRIVWESDDDSQFRGLLLNDYYRLFKQRPVRISDEPISREQKQSIFRALVEAGQLKEKDLRYTMFERAHEGYQALLYNSDQRYPVRFFVSEDYRYRGREDLNERHNDCHLK
ncbi:MAG: cobalamin-dependent protein [Erysipelotrichaceae bacterium]|nr:cobalamin-dependent protein [Erysipelotrichaceae bacterium]